MLLHTLGESALDWRWVIPALARTNRVYAPDLPGFGGSGKPAVDYSPAFFARFVASYLDALGVERARWSATRSSASSACAWRSPSLNG